MVTTGASSDVPHSKQSPSTVRGCPALLALGQVWTPGACWGLSPTSGPTYVWLPPTPSRWRISSFLSPCWHLWFRCSPQHRRNFQLEAGLPLPEWAGHGDAGDPAPGPKSTLLHAPAGQKASTRSTSKALSDQPGVCRGWARPHEHRNGRACALGGSVAHPRAQEKRTLLVCSPQAFLISVKNTFFSTRQGKVASASCVTGTSRHLHPRLHRPQGTPAPGGRHGQHDDRARLTAPHAAF